MTTFQDFSFKKSVGKEATNKKFILKQLTRAPTDKGATQMRASSKAALMITTAVISLILAIFAEEFNVIVGFMQQLSESCLAGTPRP